MSWIKHRLCIVTCVAFSKWLSAVHFSEELAAQGGNH